METLTSTAEEIYMNIRQQLKNGDANVREDAIGALRSLAEDGHLDAQVDLGVFLIGDGTSVEAVTEAVGWFRRAAERGNPQACHNLAVLLQRTGGPVEDLEQACDLSARAAEQGHPEAAYNFALIAQKLPSRQHRIIEAVAALQAISDEGGAAIADYALGVSLAEGWIGDIDMHAAMHAFARAAEKGHAAAAFNLGILFEEAAGSPEERLQARDWYEKAVDAGHPRAAQRLEAMDAIEAAKAVAKDSHLDDDL